MTVSCIAIKQGCKATTGMDKGSEGDGGRRANKGGERGERTRGGERREVIYVWRAFILSSCYNEMSLGRGLGDNHTGVCVSVCVCVCVCLCVRLCVCVCVWLCVVCVCVWL